MYPPYTSYGGTVMQLPAAMVLLCVPCKELRVPHGARSVLSRGVLSHV
jgi:hypothetical protein